MKIREIDASDVNKLQECIVYLAEHHNQISVNFKGSFPRRPYDETICSFSENLRNKESHIAVVEDADKIVGFCKVDVVGHNGKLDYLVVLQGHHGKGYGRQLMDWAMNTFREYGVNHIEVKVVDGNDAIHLYEKYGFKIKNLIFYASVKNKRSK